MAEDPPPLKQKAWLDRKVDLREAMAMTGVIVAAMGLWLPASQYIEGRPRLLLRVEEAALRSDLTPAAVLERLEHIQEHYSAVTLRWIEVRLKSSALVLDDTDSGYAKDLERFAEDVAQAVRYFDSETAGWQVHEIVYENPLITWPDGYRVNLLWGRYSAPGFQGLFGGLEREDAEAVKEAAAEFYPDRQYENALLRRRTGKELRELEGEIYETVAGKGRRLVVSVVVDNGSSLPNSVRQGGGVRLEDDNRHLSVGDLRMVRQEGDGRVDGSSGRTLTFRSDVLSVAQAEAMEPGSTFILRLEDVKDNVWKVGGKVQTTGRDGTNGGFIASLGDTGP